MTLKLCKAQCQVSATSLRLHRITNSPSRSSNTLRSFFAMKLSRSLFTSVNVGCAPMLTPDRAGLRKLAWPLSSLAGSSSSSPSSTSFNALLPFPESSERRDRPSESGGPPSALARAR